MKKSIVDPESQEAGLMPVLTFVLWLTCLVVGAVGLLEHDVGRPAPASQAAAPPTQILNVDLTEPQPPQVVEIAPTPVADITQPPQMGASGPPPDLPVVIAFNPSIAFARPMEGPVRLGDARQAIPTSRPPAAIHHLTFGQGQGIQPAPEYPREAALAGEEGVVVIKFTTGSDQRVIDAKITGPCPWPLLNQAALKKIKQDWREPPGDYEVPIQFQLQQQ